MAPEEMEIEPLTIEEPPEITDEAVEEKLEEEMAAAPPVEEKDPDLVEALKDMGLDPGKTGRVSKRLMQEISKRKAAEDKALEADSWKQEALRLTNQAGAKAPEQPIVTPTGLPAKPKWEDFEDTEKYTEALTEWKVEEKLAAREAKQRQETAARQGQEWMQKGVAKFPDFMEKTVNNNGIRITQEMATALLSHDEGPEIAYYLGTNPAESFRIAGLHPIEQAMEIRKLAGKLKMTSPKTTTEAPVPTSPVGGREAPLPDKIEEKVKKGTCTYKEYEAYMDAKERGK